jgi:hypothetical protein
VTDLPEVAKKKPASDKSAPSFHATATYKTWVRAEVKRRGWTEEEFARRITRAGSKVSSGGIHQFLGNEDEEPRASNTALMPAINKALGIAPPPLCDPTDALSQIRDRFMALWPTLSKREQNIILAALGDSPTDTE